MDIPESRGDLAPGTSSVMSPSEERSGIELQHRWELAGRPFMTPLLDRPEEDRSWYQGHVPTNP